MANPGKPGDAKLRAYPVVGGTAAGPPKQGARSMAIVVSVKRLVRDGVDFLPKGHSLPEDVWRVRHRALSYLLRAHVVGIFAFALLRGFGVVHSLVDAGGVAIFAVL